MDPANASAQGNVALIYMVVGEYRKELAASQALVKLAPHSTTAVLAVAQNYALLHRRFRRGATRYRIGQALAGAGRLAYQSLIDPKLHTQASTAVETLRKRSDLDPFSMSDVFQLELALGQNQTALEQLPKVCASFPVAGSDLSVNPTWIPLRGDPRFEALEKKYNFDP